VLPKWCDYWLHFPSFSNYSILPATASWGPPYNGYRHRLNAGYRLFGNAYDHYDNRRVRNACGLDIYRIRYAAVSQLFGIVYFIPDFMGAYLLGGFTVLFHYNKKESFKFKLTDVLRI